MKRSGRLESPIAKNLRVESDSVFGRGRVAMAEEDVASSALEGESVVVVAPGGGGSGLLLALIVAIFAGLFTVLFIALQKKKKPIPTTSDSEPHSTPNPKPTTSNKNRGSNPKQRSLAAEKAHPHHHHHHLELNTLKGHADAVTGIAFTSNGRGLATACGDRIVRVFKLDDASSKSFKFLRINLPSGSSCPTAVAFGEGASQLVVATQDLSGTGLCMYASAGGQAAAAAKEQGKLPLPDVKWELKNVHNKKGIVSLMGAPSTYGSGNGGVLVVSSSEGTDIKLWIAESGKCVGTVDTNQLKNTMATLSPNARFLAAAAFTADVKVWEVVYGKDNQVKEVTKVMQLKGHKSAVTWLDFTWDSERIVTASKDGTIRIWNINVRYHLDEDPKCLKVIQIPLLDAKGAPVHYDRLAISPDNRMLAVIHGTTLQWLELETGKVLDTAENAHDGEITSLVWAPQPLPTERGKATILATASVDKKVKLWYPPSSS
jgi:WD40 repeat protein